MKKLLVISLLLFSSLVFAQEPQNLTFEGNKMVTLDPSPDPRVTGYIIYFTDGETEWNTGSFTGTEFILEEGRLHPGKTYTFTATAHDAYGNQSVRSEALIVNIQAAQLPTQSLPDIYQPVVLPGVPVIQGDT